MGQMKKSNKILEKLYVIVCLSILIVYGVAIISVNFWGIPFIYCTDMYTDMMYAQQVWQSKSIFPEGWIFGNQLYVVATPVLSGLFYGLTENPLIAMGFASCCMGILVLVSFDWMLKSLKKTLSERLFCLTVFMTIILSSGDARLQLHGWQLFFTMCSYYSCYIITAFLGFGCYIKSVSDSWHGRPFIIAMIISCAMSFATGIQSIRQTAIMICPIVAVEICRYIFGVNSMCSIKPEAAASGYTNTVKAALPKSTITAFALAVSNIAGLALEKMYDVAQTEIYSDYAVNAAEELASEIVPSLSRIFMLLFATDNILICLPGLIIVLFFVFAVLRRESESSGWLLLLLFFASIMVILAMDIFTDMDVRNIYYFMVYPLAAIIIMYLSSGTGRFSRVLFLVLLVLMFCLNYSSKLSYLIHREYQNDSLTEVCDYLEDSGVETIYSGWNCGEKLAIESDFQLKAGFWGRDPLIGIKYLCNPEIYDAAPEKSAYIFQSEEMMEEAIVIAENAGYNLENVKYFPASNIFVCRSDYKLMQLID